MRARTSGKIDFHHNTGQNFNHHGGLQHQAPSAPRSDRGELPYEHKIAYQVMKHKDYGTVGLSEQFVPMCPEDIYNDKRIMKQTKAM